MRKTRLVIQPKRCLHTIGFLLLYLACPIIGDWGRIQPDTDMAHRAVAIEGLGARTLIKDPPSLNRRVTVDGHRACRPSEIWTRALESKQRLNFDNSQSTQRVVKEQLSLGERRENRWLDVRNQRLSTDRRADRVDDVRGRQLRRVDNGQERESRRIYRLDSRRENTREVARKESARRVENVSERDMVRASRAENIKGRESRLEEQRNQLHSEASVQRSVRKDEYNGERGLTRERESRRTSSFNMRKTRNAEQRSERVQSIEERGTRTNRLFERRGATSRTEFRRNDIPPRRLLRERATDKAENRRERSEMRETFTQTASQNRLLKARSLLPLQLNERRAEMVRPSVNSQRRLLKARSKDTLERRVEENKSGRLGHRLADNRIEPRRNTIQRRLLRKVENLSNPVRQRSSVGTSESAERQQSVQKLNDINNNRRATPRDSSMRLTRSTSVANDERKAEVRHSLSSERRVDQLGQERLSSGRNADQVTSSSTRRNVPLEELREDKRHKAGKREARRLNNEGQGMARERRSELINNRNEMLHGRFEVMRQQNRNERRETRRVERDVNQIHIRDLRSESRAIVRRSLTRQITERQERSVDRASGNDRRDKQRSEIRLAARATRLESRTDNLKSLPSRQTERIARSIDETAENNQRSLLVESRQKSMMRAISTKVFERREVRQASPRQNTNEMKENRMSERHDSKGAEIQASQRKIERENTLRRNTELERSLNRRQRDVRLASKDRQETRRFMDGGIRTSGEENSRFEREAVSTAALNDAIRMLSAKTGRQSRRQAFLAEKPYPQDKIAEMFEGKQKKWSSIKDLAANCVLGAMVWYIANRSTKPVY